MHAFVHRRLVQSWSLWQELCLFFFSHELLGFLPSLDDRPENSASIQKLLYGVSHILNDFNPNQ
jgi:hypothetical protein